MTFPLPNWFHEKEWSCDEERAAARAKFYIRLAAIYASESGTVHKLSDIASMSGNGFAVLISKQRDISAGVAVKMEKAAGRNILTREELRPDIFDPTYTNAEDL